MHCCPQRWHFQFAATLTANAIDCQFEGYRVTDSIFTLPSVVARSRSRRFDSVGQSVEIARTVESVLALEWVR